MNSKINLFCARCGKPARRFFTTVTSLGGGGSFSLCDRHAAAHLLDQNLKLMDLVCQWQSAGELHDTELLFGCLLSSDEVCQECKKRVEAEFAVPASSTAYSAGAQLEYRLSWQVPASEITRKLQALDQLAHWGEPHFLMMTVSVFRRHPETGEAIEIRI
jgi:hypothetical protein